jgi:hypothetical protein
MGLSSALSPQAEPDLPGCKSSLSFASGQKRPSAPHEIQKTGRTRNGLDGKRKSLLEGLYSTWRRRLDRILSAPRTPLP